MRMLACPAHAYSLFFIGTPSVSRTMLTMLCTLGWPLGRPLDGPAAPLIALVGNLVPTMTMLTMLCTLGWPLGRPLDGPAAPLIALVEW